MNPFELVEVGSTDVKIQQLGLGTAPLGGWPKAVSEDQAKSTIRRAWKEGIRYFDTAPFYGHGFSEKMLGSVLSEKERSSFTISTKVGRLLQPGDPDTTLFEGTPPLEPVFDFSADGVKKSLASSRERFMFDGIDIALIHDPDDHHDQAINEAYPALAELRDIGELSAIGVGMNWAEPLAEFAEAGDFDCFLMAGRYTLLEQDSLDTLLPMAEAQGSSIIAGGVYNSGLLVDPGPDATYDYEPATDDVISKAQELQSVCQDFDVPLRAAALQFPLGHPAVSSIVVGARTPEEVTDNLVMFQQDIPSALWQNLKDQGLVRCDAPIPE